MVMDAVKHAHNELSVSRWRRYEIRSADSFEHAKEIRKPWGALEPVLDWCKTEMQADWRWQLVEMSSDIQDGRYIFYFDNEQDFCTFVLKWG